MRDDVCVLRINREGGRLSRMHSAFIGTDIRTLFLIPVPLCLLTVFGSVDENMKSEGLGLRLFFPCCL